MKITKLVHSCVIAEQNNKKILVDPGIYSWQSGKVNDEHLANLEVVVITHAHPDHLEQSYVEAIKTISPNAQWYGPQQVVAQLSSWGIQAKFESSDPDIKFVDSKHAALAPWFSQQPDHTSYVLFGEILIGGDCHTFTEAYGARIFGAAINGGPWGSVVGFSKMIESMKSRPQMIIPLHDWHWNEEARHAIYEKLPEVLERFDVQFVTLENGISREI